MKEKYDFGELEKVMENVSNLISDKAAAKNLELVIKVEKNTPNYLIGDPLRIGQTVEEIIAADLETEISARAAALGGTFAVHQYDTGTPDHTLDASVRAAFVEDL